MMQLRPYMRGGEDHAMISKWWKHYKWEPVNPMFLPHLGAVVYDTETDKQFCAGFCYLDSTSLVGMMEWIVTNPENSPKESYKALNILVKHLTDVALKMGYRFIITSSDNPALIRLLEKKSFVKTDRNVTHMVLRKKEMM